MSEPPHLLKINSMRIAPKPIPENGRIVYIQYTNPTYYPPIEHSATIFRANGWRVTLLGIHSKGETNNLQFDADLNAETKFLPNWGNRSLLKLHFCIFVFWCWATLYLRRPNLVWLSDRMACPVGALLALTTSIPLVYQEHDGQANSQKGIDKLLDYTRKLTAARSIFCILPNSARAEIFQTEIPNTRQILTVMNCPSIAETENLALAQNPSDRLRLYYHGSLGPSRLPLTILAALQQLPDGFELTIVGYETNNSGYLSHFLEQAAVLGLRSRVHYEGALTPRDVLLRRCSQSDVGLALLPLGTKDPNERSMAGATNKIFDYLACGIPALVPDMPDQVQMFVNSGVALACDPGQPDSIAAAFDWFAKHPAETRAMGKRGRARILTDWNYENQFKPVLNAIRS